jgi:hypothetical protein
MCTLRAEQIKNTKTILRVYTRGTGGVYRRLSTAKKYRQAIKHEIFCGTGFYKRQEKKLQREEKE